MKAITRFLSKELPVRQNNTYTETSINTTELFDTTTEVCFLSSIDYIY